MKFSITRSRFLEALQTVQNVVTGKGALQILQNALIKAEGNTISIVTTDVDISEQSTIELSADVDAAGQTTLPIKRLVGVIRELSDDIVEIDVDDNDVANVKCGSSYFKFIGLPARDFPPIPLAEGEFSYSVQRATLREMLRKTSYAVSLDETRRVLNGVLLSFKGGKLTVVGTDGRRLALVEKEVEFPEGEDRDMILPSKAVSELTRMLDGEGEVRIFPKQNQAVFSWDGKQLATKLIDGHYPDFAQVIPRQCEERVIIERDSFLAAIRRVSTVTMERDAPLSFTFTANQLTIRTNAAGEGEGRDTLPVKYVGKEITIIFNPEYVMEPLRVIDDDDIIFEMTDGQCPAVIKCSIPFLYVLMPLRNTQS